ncbi:hypothetical protein ACS8FD_03580 [Psychrobacter sp. 1U2]|uniref:hypothetical protein n=1 Tax=Psychrobacter sp. 1U2 TaxID=3453577 RepID=UPI003F474B3A
MSEKFDSFLNRLRPLSYHVNNELKETLFKNEAYLDNRSSFLEASVVSWSNSYKKYLLLLVILCLMVGVNAYLWMSYITAYFQIKKDSSLLGILLTGQITIVGLIYPLVISLVSILFQDKAGKKIIFSLYQKYSGFMFAGLSGLSLAIILAFSLILNAALTDRLSLILNTTLTFWFVFNLFLTVWFFIKTLSVLDENKKDEFVFRFVTNEVCETDLKQRIRSVYLKGLFQYKLLRNGNDDVLTISNDLISNKYDKEVRYVAGRYKELLNISLWKINLAIWLQSNILKKSTDINNIESNKCKFYVCIPEFTNGDKSVILTKYSGFDINILVSLLIKNSVRYEKKSNKTDISISSALEAFTSPIYTALNNNDESQFVESLDRLARYHIQLAEVLSFENLDGKYDNWLLLNEGTWGFSYFTNFMRTYYVLLKQTIDKIPSNTQYFYHSLRFYRKIFFEQKYITQSEAETVLRNTLYLWVALLKWKNLSDKADVAVSDGFEDSINNFVSVWEEWKNTYIKHKYKEVDRSYKILFEHLKYTAEMVVESLSFDNDYALSWSTDMLIHWKNRTLDVQTYNEEHLWHSGVIDIEMIFNGDTDLWLKIRKGSDKNLESAINIALKNAYIDTRFLIVCSMLANSENILRVKPYIYALLEEKRIHPTGTHDIKVRSINQASQLLGVYIRHKKFHSGGVESYSGWQAKLTESFSRKFSQKMVSGRIYAGWYNVSIDNEFVQLIVSYSSAKWKISGDWFDVLKSNVYSFSNRKDMIRSFKALIEIAQKTSEYKLLFSETTTDKVMNYRTNFIESMEELIYEIEQINNNYIINSDIDKIMLSEIAKVASNDFIANEAKFPLNIFDEIKKEKAGLISSNRVIQENFEKSYIMSEDGPEIHNMVDSCGEMISDYLRNIVLNTVVRTNVTDELCFESLESLLFYISNETKMPDAVLLCHQSISELIFDLLSEDEQKVEQFKITKIYSEEYFCKIGDCEVYKDSFNIVNSCILTTKDRFKDLVLQDFEDDNIVNVVFDENEQDKTKGDLSFDYKLDIETDENKSFIKLNLIPENIESDEEVVEEHIDDINQEELNEDKTLSRLDRVFKFISAYRR